MLGIGKKRKEDKEREEKRAAALWDSMQEVKELAARLEGLVQAGSEHAEEAMKELRETSGRQAAVLGDMQKAIGRHDMAQEEMLDEWDELREQIRSSDRQPEVDALLGLCGRYEEGLHLLRQAFSGNKDWEDQMALLDASLSSARLRAGLVVTGKAGEMVDYDLHEVISVTETDQPEKNGTVETTFAPGYVYQGKVKKKARVGAYRLRA